MWISKREYFRMHYAFSEKEFLEKNLKEANDRNVIILKKLEKACDLLEYEKRKRKIKRYNFVNLCNYVTDMSKNNNQKHEESYETDEEFLDRLIKEEEDKKEAMEISQKCALGKKYLEEINDIDKEKS